MNTLISVIIPSYNCADVLENAVSSITKHVRNLDEIEILIVENGSTDRTTETAERLQSQYPCVKALHSSKGVSNARNKGIEEAKGTWVTFLDADDRFTDDGMEILLRDAKNEQSDICFYSHMNGNEARILCKEKQVYEGEHLDTCKVMMISNPTWYFAVWAKLIRRSLLTDNHIQFNKELRLAEDGDFMLHCLEKAASITVKSDIIYQYVISGASTMRSFDGNKIKDYMTSMIESQKTVENASPEVKKAFVSYILMHLNIAMVRETFSFNNPCSFGEKYKKMNEVIKTSIFQQAIEQTQIRECFSVRMSPILCLKLKCKPFAAAIYCIRALQNHLKEK